MATDALDIAGIDAFYGDSHVLHGVSFTLQPGRLLGLLGPQRRRQDHLHERDHGLSQAAHAARSASTASRSAGLRPT